MLWRRHRLVNAAIFFGSFKSDISQLSLLKMLYFCDEISIIRNKRPFFWTNYYAWRLGPVEVEIYRYSTDSSTAHPYLVNGFSFSPLAEGKVKHVTPRKPFDSRFFSKSDISILEEVSRVNYEKFAFEKSEITHRKGGPWDLSLTDEEKVAMDMNILNTTDKIVDLSVLLNYPEDLAEFQNKLFAQRNNYARQ